MTTHKSQGGTFDRVVFEYNRNMQQQLVYVALSRVKSLDGLFLINPKNDMKFYHGTPLLAPSLMQLQTELQRLQGYTLTTTDEQHSRRLENVGRILVNINAQSLPAHVMVIKQWRSEGGGQEGARAPGAAFRGRDFPF